MKEKYLLHGKLTAGEGHVDELTDILLQASELVATAPGCRLYVISKDEGEADAVYVTEIWDSKDDHDNSLKVPGVKELIMKAVPLLADKPEKGQEFKILGGAGL